MGRRLTLRRQRPNLSYLLLTAGPVFAFINPNKLFEFSMTFLRSVFSACHPHLIAVPLLLILIAYCFVSSQEGYR